MNDVDFVGAIVSLLALAATVVGLSAQLKDARRLAASDLLLRLRSDFNSRPIRLLRAEAAKGIRAGTYPNQSLSEVLDWLSQIAALVDSRTLHQNLAYDHFCYWLIGYWETGVSFVQQARSSDPGSWKTLQRVIEHMRRRRSYQPDADAFLDHEIQQIHAGAEP